MVSERLVLLAMAVSAFFPRPVDASSLRWSSTGAAISEDVEGIMDEAAAVVKVRLGTANEEKEELAALNRLEEMVKKIDARKRKKAEPVSEQQALTTEPDYQYVAKVAILGGLYGCVFGMMGAGGSLILKPLLYFAFDVAPFKITIFNAFLMLIVLAGYGATLGHLKGRVVWQDVGRLGLCVSAVGCVCGALLSSRVSDEVQLVCFAVLITLAAAYMLLPKKTDHAEKGGSAPTNADARSPEDADACTSVKEDVEQGSMSFGTMAIGVAIGICSGFTGVGGGFMLVPLLTHMGHDMTTAVPTSQAMICLSSIVGFVWYGFLNDFGIAQLHLLLCLSLTVVAMIGLYCSDVLGAMLAQATRQRIFALLLICIGVFTIVTLPGVSSYVAQHLASQ